MNGYIMFAANKGNNLVAVSVNVCIVPNNSYRGSFRFTEKVSAEKYYHEYFISYMDLNSRACIVLSEIRDID